MDSSRIGRLYQILNECHYNIYAIYSIARELEEEGLMSDRILKKLRRYQSALFDRIRTCNQEVHQLQVAHNITGEDHE